MNTVAVIGASTNPEKFGNRAVRAYIAQGWTVYPVNPSETTIEGLSVYRSIRDVPQPVDRVSLYLPPHVGITILEDIAAIRPGEVYVNPGSESPELIERAQELGLTTIQACSIIDSGRAPAPSPVRHDGA